MSYDNKNITRAARQEVKDMAPKYIGWEIEREGTTARLIVVYSFEGKELRKCISLWGVPTQEGEG